MEKLTQTEGRNELRKLMDRFPSSSRSDQIRVELSDTIVAAYVNNYIDGTEYHEMMAYVR